MLLPVQVLDPENVLLVEELGHRDAVSVRLEQPELSEEGKERSLIGARVRGRQGLVQLGSCARKGNG